MAQRLKQIPMALSDFFGSNRFGLSFELFPPKTDAGLAALYRHVEVLLEFEPNFVTCTYGAGGSTQDKTLQIVEAVKQRFGVHVASHLTCVGSTVDDLRSYLRAATERGVDSIVALRGDPPQGETHFQAVDGGLQYANELVSLIHEEFPNFGLAVAGYPETHQEAPSAEVDLENLKRKVDTGADIVMTQLFYENQDFYRFRDQCQATGIQIPVVPGLLPVTNLHQIQRITSLCGARLPADFVNRLAEKEDDQEWQFQVGVDFAINQVRELIEQGVPGVHFYVLNKSQATSQVLRALNLPHRNSETS
ncbi:MAG: methylenetetrahydrofolate reductase [NAD(P)H] [Pirellulaceae bacterium]|nr:methylenetetrahydrofolate reductase [NAD(P)H] [Pirellulaceae bacterium]